MLIFIELSPSQIQNMSTGEREAFFERIIESSRLGHHRFAFSKDLSNWAREFNGFPKEISSHMEYLEEMNSYQILMKNELDHVFLDVHFGSDKPSFEIPNVWKIGHRELVDGNYLDPCQLLVENEQSDGKFYELVFNHLKKQDRKNFAYLRFDISSGHKDGVGRELLKLIDEKQIVCCICDSDKLTSVSDGGSTYQGTRNKIQHKKFIGHFECTPGRESENFLSLDIIEEIFLEKGRTQKSHVALKIRKLMNSQSAPKKGDCLWLYFDIKSGMTGVDLILENISDREEEWLCKKYNVKDIREIEIPKLGKNILGRFLNSHTANMAFHSHMRSEYWRKHFSEWFEQYLWYMVGQAGSDY